MPDTATLWSLLDAGGPGWREFLDSGPTAVVARAPGRLDVLGGIADYSGSLVLELPLACAAWALCQPRTDGVVRIRSRLPGTGETLLFDTTTAALGTADRPVPLSEVAALFSADDRWAAYIAGCWSVLAHETPDLDLSGGGNVLLVSDVPAGAGVSSSAALEVATMRALTAGRELDGMALALLCQRVENLVAGAPCGIMDQATSALGQANRLLALRCQPHTVEGYPSLPDRLRVLGIDCGVKHSVGGSAYVRARVGAFMAHRILTAEAPRDPTGGYLARITPETFRTDCARLLPEGMTGAEFLERYGSTIDPVTRVDPDETYPVLEAARFPIEENRRAELLLDALRTADYPAAGAQMNGSHEGYGRVGLGSAETDAIADAVRAEGPENGLYGARVTGGGAGGTVAVMAAAVPAAESALERVIRRSASVIGRRPTILSGSSDGALRWPPTEILLDSPV